MADAAKTKTKAPATDQLSQLLTSVSGLAMALVENGIDLKEGDDPVDQAIAIVKRWRELTIARAELLLTVAVAVDVEPDTIEDPFAAATGALETMKIRLVELEEQIKLLSDPPAGGGPTAEQEREAEFDQLRKRAAVLEIANKELEEDLEQMTNARNVLANKLADEGKSQSEPLVEPEIREKPKIIRERPESARDVGPAHGKAPGADVQAALAAGATLELAFSNGEFEIIDFSAPTVTVSDADVVRIDGSRFRLKDGVEITGGVMPERVHGCGLLIEGAQVAYCQFEPAADVHPKTHWRFQPIFG